MPSSKLTLPYKISSLQAQDAALMIQRNFEAILQYSDGKLGQYTPDAVREIEEDASLGLIAYEQTQIYRAQGIPTNNPVPAGISKVAAPNGTMLTTLSWTYSQGTIPADFLLIFKEWHASENPGVPEPTDPAIAVKPTEGASVYTFEGLNPSYKWSFAVAAARKTEGGLEVGPLQSIAAWQNVTIGTPNFEGTVSGTPATKVSETTSNFNTRNDRKGTPPAKPTIKTDGTAVDHTINDDGSADVSFEWLFSGAGDAADIDGFIVYVRQGSTSTPYVMGTKPEEEHITYLPASVRSHILYGVRSDGYYTFAVQAYRDVDQDINSAGRLYSAVIQPTRAEERPYHPSSTVEFKGDITGTVGGVPVERIATTIGAGDGSDGNLSTTDDVVFPVSMDGDAVIKEYESLTVNAGDLLTTENPCRGLFILCRGDCTINGTISMDDKAAAIGSGWPGGTAAQFALTSPISGEFAFMLVPLAGAGGSGGDGAPGYISIGGSGVPVRGGRGGRGGVNSAYGGSGGGGGGGGGAKTRTEYGTTYFLGGGAGGLGAGNGGGGGDGGGSSLGPADGYDGGFGRGGGIIALIVGGKLTIGSTGKITASATIPGKDGVDGVKSGSYYGGGGGGGGGTGGGVIVLAHKGGLINNGVLLVYGSPGGAGGRSAGSSGQPGQEGAIRVVQL